MKLYWLVTEKTQVTEGRTDGRTEVPTLGHFLGSPLKALLGIYCWVVETLYWLLKRVHENVRLLGTSLDTNNWLLHSTCN